MQTQEYKDYMRSDEWEAKKKELSSSIKAENMSDAEMLHQKC